MRILVIFVLMLATTMSGLAQEKTVPASQGEIQLSFVPVVKKVSASVVNVYATKITQQRLSTFRDPFFERFFGGDSPFFQSRPRKSQSLGSGVIVGDDGTILTNHHVIAGASDIRVSLVDGREFHTELVLADEETDLAVLKVVNMPASGLVPLKFAAHGELEIGDLVLAIGNPFGVGQTVTSGIVSALARTGVGVGDFQFFIQTDAAIYPGNSGGALVNMRGELVGVNTAIFTRSGGSDGIGFAIPAKMAEFVANAARDDGEIVRPWLGARLQALSSDLAASLLLGPPRGALITDVYPGGPADMAGLQSGDVILEIDGQTVQSPGAFDYQFSTMRVGEETSLYVARGADALEIQLSLIDLDPVDSGISLFLSDAGRFSGATVAQIGAAMIERLELPYNAQGVIVSKVAAKSPAAQLGLRVGDIILSLNGQAIQSVGQLQKLVQQRVGSWRIQVRRGTQVINSIVSG